MRVASVVFAPFTRVALVSLSTRQCPFLASSVWRHATDGLPLHLSMKGSGVAQLGALFATVVDDIVRDGGMLCNSTSSNAIVPNEVL
jgi:hypothetical protein